MLVIHIGTQKTGTSALQAHLKRNSKVLLDQGIRYLQTGREEDQRTSHNEAAQSILGKGDVSIWSGIRDEIARSESRVNLISAEGFWFCDPAALKEQLQDVKEIQIVVYLRRQDQYLQSLYKQAVTGGRRHNFNDWREKLPFRGNYLSAIERWADAFGADSLVLRPYERHGIVDTISDFCEVIGALGLTDTRNPRRNPSPRRELLHFIRAFNQLHVDVDRQQLFQALIRREASYARSCDLLSFEECVSLMDSLAEENRILVEKYYRDMSTPLFPEMIRSEAPVTWELGSEAFFKMTVDVLEVMINFSICGRISTKESKTRGVAGSAPSRLDGIDEESPRFRRLQRMKSRQAARSAGTPDERGSAVVSEGEFAE